MAMTMEASDGTKESVALGATSFAEISESGPMARRTRHEIRAAQLLALRLAGSPETWAKCLLGACYSLYFIILPCQLTLHPGKSIHNMLSIH